MGDNSIPPAVGANTSDRFGGHRVVACSTSQTGAEVPGNRDAPRRRSHPNYRTAPHGIPQSSAFSAQVSEPITMASPAINHIAACHRDCQAPKLRQNTVKVAAKVAYNML